MRVAVVAGPDPGHAFPAIALGLALRRRGCAVAFVSGTQWASVPLEFIPIGATPAQPEDADFGWVLWERPKQLVVCLAFD